MTKIRKRSNDRKNYDLKRKYAKFSKERRCKIYRQREFNIYVVMIFRGTELIGGVFSPVM